MCFGNRTTCLFELILVISNMLGLIDFVLTILVDLLEVWISVEKGFDGYVYGEAISEEVLKYYIEKFNAYLFPYGEPIHPYRFIIDENNVKPLIEEYDYEENGEELWNAKVFKAT